MQRTDYRYTPLFCEENIWQLAGALQAEGLPIDALAVLFLSNPDKQVALFNQRRGGVQGFVVWDYHVVLQVQHAGDELILDFDTKLEFPVAARDYFAASFPDQQRLPPALRGWVRRIPAGEYLYRFYSDRSHMLGQVGEDEFPPYPPITPAHAGTIPLGDYWDMQKPLVDGSELFTVEDYASLLA